MQYKLFQIALCKMLGYNVGNLTTDHVDCHVYDNQVEYVEELLQREYGKAGTVRLDKDVHSIDDIIALEASDFIVEGYEPNRVPFVSPRPEMAV